ncbi:DUF5999 family protein [Streptomyces jumonjinensis]|uniref:DUF5999 family protein n=1 Tax=Streptomyces jumonjinensis TaxID=1945 RepID=UPI0037BCFBE8
MTGHTCGHEPRCPRAEAADREAARAVVVQTVQGWVLLCNQVIRFDDNGCLLPDGRAVAPQRPIAPAEVAA